MKNHSLITTPIPVDPIHKLETPASAGRSELASLPVVETEPSLAQFFVMKIIRVGYAVRLAADDDQVIQRIDQQVPALIVQASMLPTSADWQVLCRVRDAIRHDVAVLMSAVGNGEHELVRALDLDTYQIFSEPCGTRELSARVQVLSQRAAYSKHSLEMDSPPEAASELLQYGELILNRPGRTATLCGERIHLSRGEFDLLSIFVQHPGRCLSRAELLAIARQECYVPGDRSVDNMVLRLRKKLGSYGGDLATVWGVGYRLRGR